MNIINYLITGGAGFIGTNLCKYLLENTNDKIIILDNFNTNSSHEIYNLERKYKNRLIIIVEDVCNLNMDYYHKLFINKYKILKINVIFHLACNASPKNYQKNPIQTLDTCYIGTKNILEIAKYNQSRMIYSSTSEIYGNPKIQEQDELYFGNVNPIGPRSCYDEGKRIGETLCYEYKNLNVNIGIVRIFNTYGPYMSVEDGRVIPNFITQALNDKNITIYGDGTQTRSFCYIDDLIQGLLKFITVEELGPINLGNDNEMSILDLSKKIIELTNSKSIIEFFKLPIDDPIIRKPILKKAKKILNWEPKINLENGLKKTINYFK
jgi:UDP-glucuronate decarboxylase